MSSTKTSKEVQPQEWPDEIIATDLIPAHAGMNRLVWDLRMNDPVQIPGAVYEDQAPRGPIVPPGRYQVRLTVGGVTRTQPITVYADPRAPGSGPAISAKTAMAVAVWKDIDALHRAVNSIRERRKALKAADDTSGMVQRLAAIEEQLMQVNMNGSEANLAFPGMLNEQYAGFAAGLEDADTPPTQQQTALFELPARQAAEATDGAGGAEVGGGGGRRYRSALKIPGFVPIAWAWRRNTCPFSNTTIPS